MTARTQPSSVHVIGWAWIFTALLEDGCVRTYHTVARCQGDALTRVMAQMDRQGIVEMPVRIDYRRVES